MRRDNLFRGKRVDNGEWVEGYFIQTLIGGKEVSIIVPKGAFDGMRISDKIYQIDPETVEQYIGHTDDSDTMIFEGDVVRIRSGECWFGIYEIDTKKAIKSITDEICVHLGDFESVEIIGNIHDNPELLKGDAQTTDCEQVMQSAT